MFRPAGFHSGQKEAPRCNQWGHAQVASHRSTASQAPSFAQAIALAAKLVRQRQRLFTSCCRARWTEPGAWVSLCSLDQAYAADVACDCCCAGGALLVMAL
ncbi:unnamed protein product [Effrenium voratum]|uniref:Uncharacterized protein n=1 Tax=Effrenium voratum TaxID=2562239 RepID=A0AA36IZD4_9DINO|nr:unnamed protein product [Effrenium voratum]CAJ1444430.1 unnamed protein product [Effrenium voratum]